MSDLKTIRVVAAVIRGTRDDKEKIFATARGYGDYKGWWEFPGGELDSVKWLPADFEVVENIKEQIKA